MFQLNNDNEEEKLKPEEDKIENTNNEELLDLKNENKIQEDEIQNENKQENNLEKKDFKVAKKEHKKLKTKTKIAIFLVAFIVIAIITTTGAIIYTNYFNR